MITTTLIDYLNNGYLLVTPNNRLSQQLCLDFYDATATTVLPAPLCFPYQTFLHRLFQNLQHHTPFHPHPLLLSTLQERYLWKTLLQPVVYDTVGLLEAVADAWARCQCFGLDIMHADFSLTPHTQQFQDWAQAFVYQLEHHHAITPAQLVDYLCTYPLHCEAQTIVWVCFDDWTPEQQRLQAAFTAQGFSHLFYDYPEKKSVQALQYAAADDADEHLQWIHWAKSHLSAGETPIGIVVPTLQAQAPFFKRLLSEHFLPEHINLSLGQPLSHYPLVAHALMGLNLNLTLLTPEHTHLLLHSPYFHAHETESLARMAAWQTHPFFHEPLAWQSFLHALAPLSPGLHTALSHLTPYPATASLFEWIDHFKGRLLALGFPGGTAHDSQQYQCFQRFMDLFDDFLQQALITPDLSASDALQLLEELARHTLFQPQQPAQAPIHVLGLLEASGCYFQHLWVTGLTDACLPQPTHYSPFIPIHLQRAHHLPRTSVHKEQLLAQQLIQRFQWSSESSLFSYAQWHEDVPQLPSPLIKDLAPFSPLPSEAPSLLPLLSYTDPDTVPLTDHDSRSSSTQLLAYQAQCPFRAFAAIRLHAKPVEQEGDGLTLRERGLLLHHALELLWRHLKDQATLLRATADELTACVTDCIQRALKRYASQKPYSFSQAIQIIEQRRLERLIRACLEWDKQRPPFTIAALEKKYTLQIETLTLNLRIDRLDQCLDTPEQWLIDYKTSLPPALPWTEERLEAPQLPLYALLEETIHAVLFVQLKAGHLAIRGLSAKPCTQKGIQSPPTDSTWETYKIMWRQQLATLALEYQHGLITPTPHRESTCNSCEFRTLCRKM